MATWFDKDRGVHSGRIKPETIQPTDGEYVFVLGAEDQGEPAYLSAGDYTEVKQVVDLTGYDLVGATMKTIGALVGYRRPEAGFETDPDTLFSFDFNIGTEETKNLVDGAFNISEQGTVNVGTETYSPDNTYCKIVPEGVAAAKIAGVNNPQTFPASLSAYTFQWWMNWDSNVFSAATGITPIILKAGHEDVSGAGIKIELSPIAGTHQWRIVLKHIIGTTTYSTPFTGFVFDQPLGWKLFTLRYDQSLSTQADLFVDTVNVSSNLMSLPIPTQLQLDEEISFMSKDLVGGFDQTRFISRWLDDLEIEESYNQCVNTPSPTFYKWTMQILIDGIVYAERQIKPDEERTWTDFLAPVRLLTGPHSVSFRLGMEIWEDADALYRVTESNVYRETEDGIVRSVWP